MKQRTIRLAATGARVATGAVIAAACVLGVIGAANAPWPEIGAEPASTTVTPVPGDTRLVCNGSFRALGRDASQADLMLSAAVPQLKVGTADGEAESAPLEMPGLTGGSGAQTITGTVQARQAPLVAASEAVRLNAADLRGFAAAPCREAGMGTWLVGGDVSTGASDVILLSNPGTVPATVDLNVYGTKRSTSTTVIPPKTQLGLSLASVSAGEQRPVIEVVASGAPVRAVLQSALVRTLDPVGIDLQDGMGGPQKHVEMVGVISSPVVAGDDSTGIVLRMLSPEQDAAATVRVRGIGSGRVLDEYPVELAAAVPFEIALTDLPAGAYTIEVDAEQPVVAAARQSTRVGTAEDFSWMLPAPQLTGTSLFSVPSGVAAKLYLRNPAGEPVTVTLDGPGGREVEVPADGSATVGLRAGIYTLISEQPVHAAIGLNEGTDAAIAGWPLWSPPATQRPIVVHP